MKKFYKHQHRRNHQNILEMSIAHGLFVHPPIKVLLYDLIYSNWNIAIGNYFLNK